MTIPDHIVERKAPRKMADVPLEVIEMLNLGHIATLNLTEWLCVDHGKLISELLCQSEHAEVLEQCTVALAQMPKRSVLQSILIIGRTLADCDSAIAYLGRHSSDSARSYAVCAIGARVDADVEDVFADALPYAADAHFGVRELAWLGLRNVVERDLNSSIRILSNWAANRDANVRRFASEITRPRGVWCRHLNELKSKPEKAYSILEPLRADDSKYVQDSVANWLNDASKTRPEWVREVCAEWLNSSLSPHTERIVHRVLRSLRKADL